MEIDPEALVAQQKVQTAFQDENELKTVKQHLENYLHRGSSEQAKETLKTVMS